LYATAALESGQLDAADAALQIAEARHPLDPALMLVRADLLLAQHEYARAITELRRARDIAQPEQRGRYALALAQQHLRLTYDLCGGGITAAREAVTIAAADPDAWQSLAAALYHCRAYAEAASAARSGLALAPARADLDFFLGAALWAAGQRDEARPFLIAAIDRAPASEWRVRAEQLLGW
jgi:tetratricopeptide (TPR) repeat protein